jgi:AcrR family transcriptional regulator
VSWSIGPIIYRSIEKATEPPDLRHAEVMSASARRPGRPRSSSAPDPSADTREAILDAAADLFASHGYAATGTREIAAHVGLRQASLFHYFARKDDLLAELLDRTVAPSLAATDWLVSASGRPDIRLFLLARQDTLNLCGRRHDLALLQLLPEARAERFASFWAKRAELQGRYRALIDEAVTAGLLIDLPVATLTDLVFGAVEATMMWFDPTGSTTPEEAADAVAVTAVRGVLARPSSAAQLRRAAERHGNETGLQLTHYL